MKRIVLVAALCSALSSVLAPVTANALPVGGSWGIQRDKIVKELLSKGSFQETEKAILEKVVVPHRKHLFRNEEGAFEIQERYRSIISALGLRVSCNLLDPKGYSGQRWMVCTY
ncbi:hypothetical protein X471_00720 [Bartonella bacilliformis str. Heidi Mejia]|nr:hypothetical protein [Bartonella bacilliformis]EYS91832.1 hypothetical protein X471_00720 [Bartonella bacilliformis str. Heidi Mejia]KEG18511.1 hypothetical protein H707_00230 [Bartonella bacilliformis Hosp800-02]KEG24655.1 hypothetical protein H706_00956 [Bartonella bacilliformis CAR600-02]